MKVSSIPVVNVTCDHLATTQRKLTLHVKVMHEGFRYACDQCDYKATRKDNLLYLHINSKHSAKHEGVKYACDYCDYQARRKDNLAKHTKSIHEGIKYACDYHATRQDNLIVHKKKLHQ